MNNMVLHKAATRGHADFGWLNAHHTFSFANYYDPERMHFGVLRVLNDDVIAAGKGFSTHPHDNMEIITIPLSGTIAHKDSMGNSGTVSAGEVQVMSAGTGIQHSEFNYKEDAELNLLQIWLFPKKRQVTPRYQQLTLDPKDRVNAFQQVLSPNADDAGVWIHQDAWFNIGKFDGGRSTSYAIERPGNGVYAFMIEGEATINGQAVGRRDGLGIWDIDKLDINVGAMGAEILLMDVPMRIG
ncbi:MAG TPA: pirin family protein [Flavobacteriales bacterium]|nr:pirin family protein [Flavobacteriales bacterium]